MLEISFAQSAYTDYIRHLLILSPALKRASFLNDKICFVVSLPSIFDGKDQGQKDKN